MHWRTIILSGAGGLLVGVIAILGVRFFTYNPDQVHYHANFAVYINGQQQTFDQPIYYLDGSCSMTGVMTPETRAHLTKGYDGVVHIQDEAATWGQFFENLGWYVGDDFIKTNDDFYIANDTSKLHIILNGQDYTGLGGITNTVIGDRDRLLLSYGDEDRATVNTQYKSVPDTAAQYDGMKGVSSCGHVLQVTNRQRLEHLF